MRHCLEKITALVAALTVFLLSAVPCCAAVAYPEGVTDEQIAVSIEKTDRLIRAAAPALTGKTVPDFVHEILYKDETVTEVFVSAYTSLEEQSETLTRLGLDLSPARLAVCLAAYPDAASVLAAAPTWSGVDLSPVSWGIASDTDFANLVASMIEPFNDVLYMLLCGGEYKASVFTIQGGDGYTAAILPLLQTLQCPYILPTDKFAAEAAQHKNAMVFHIVTSLLSLVNEAADYPANTLTRVLPAAADYLRGDGFTKAVAALAEPVTVRIGNFGRLFSGTKMISFFMFLQDPDKYTTDFSQNLPSILNEATQNFSMDLPQIDVDGLAECKGNQNAAYLLIMRWLINFLKENGGQLEGLGIEGVSAPADPQTVQMLAGITAKDTDEILKLLIRLFTVTAPTIYEYEWKSAPYTPAAVVFTPNLTRENFQKVLDGIDELINEAVADLTEYQDVGTVLKRNIYTNDLITTLAKSLYGALEGDAAQMLSMLGIPSSPAQLAEELSGGNFSSARSSLSRHAAWSGVGSVSWGFANGNRDGFRAALTAVLRPLRPALEMILAGGCIEIFDSINIPGSNGYNTAVIPILEALGCESAGIKTYAEYSAGKGTDAVITDIVDPVLSLIDAIAERPVYNVVRIVPNILYFLKNGGVSQCLDNLIRPLTAMAQEFGLDLSAMTGQLDALKGTDLTAQIENALTELTSGSGINIKLEKPDLNLLASLGTLVKVQSKRTFNGAPAQIDAVQADGPAIMVTVLRYVVRALQNPENADLLGGMMSGGGDDSMFAQFAGGIGGEFQGMTTDELIEWLYKLFFRERAIEEHSTGEEYIPTVIYEKPKTTMDNLRPLLKAGAVVLVVGVLLIIERKNIADGWYRIQRKKEEARKNAGS